MALRILRPQDIDKDLLTNLERVDELGVKPLQVPRPHNALGLAGDINHNLG